MAVQNGPHIPERMACDSRDLGYRTSRLSKASDCCSAQVVKAQPFDAGLDASLAPGSAKAALSPRGPLCGTKDREFREVRFFFVISGLRLTDAL